MLSSFTGEYILKIHGTGHSDVLLQVARREDLDIWYERFNLYNRLQQCQQAAFYNSSANLPPSLRQNHEHLFNAPFGAIIQQRNNTMDTITMTSMLSSHEYHDEDDDDDNIIGGILNNDGDGDHEDSEERKNKSKKSTTTTTTTLINNNPTADLLQD